MNDITKRIGVEFLSMYFDGPDWQSQGACRGRDPDLFFPGEGQMSQRFAKAVCRECMVRDECLEYALETDQAFGVWGGMGERERKRERRRRQQVARSENLAVGG